MKSKTSFFNLHLYKKHLSKFFLASVAYFIFYLLMIPINFVNNVTGDYNTGVRTISEKMWTLERTIANASIAAPVALFCILLGIAVFSYLYKSKSIHMMHAFPFTRKTLFGTGVVSILTLAIFPQLLIAMITTIVAVKFGVAAFAWMIWYWFLCMITYTLCFTGIALIAVMASGQRITSFVFFWIFNYMFYFMENIVTNTVETLCYGFTSGNLISDKLSFLSPILSLSDKTGINVSEGANVQIFLKPSNFIANFAFMAAGIVLLFVANYMYQKKKTETAQDFIAVPILKPIFSVCLSVFGGLFFAQIAKVVYLDNRLVPKTQQSVFLITASVILLIIIYFISKMLIERNLKVFNKKNAKSCAILAAIVLVATTLISLDVFKIENYMPKKDNVKAVYLQYAFEDFALTNEEEIKAAMELHKTILANKQELKNYQSSHTDNYTEEYSFLNITYKTKNGSFIRRSYVIPDHARNNPAYQTILDKTTAFINDPERIKIHGISVNYKDLILENFQMDNFYGNNYPSSGWETIIDSNEMDLRSEQLQALYKAILKDIDEGNCTLTYLGGDDMRIFHMSAEFISPEEVALDSSMAQDANARYYRGFIGSILGMKYQMVEDYVHADTYIYQDFYFTSKSSHTMDALSKMGIERDGKGFTIVEEAK